MKKAIIFDFDGTLVDSFNLVNFSILKVVNNHLNIKLKQEEALNNGKEDSAVIFLLTYLLNLSTTELFNLLDKDINDNDILEFNKLFDLYLHHNKPIQYLVGKTTFYGYDFKVNEDVLIPRFETEELVENILYHYDRYFKDKDVEVVDIGTGSGCIAISLALEEKHMHLTATDISGKAICVAKENALNLGAKVDFLIGDIKLYYFPSQKLRQDDEVYLGEVFSNIIYNDQSREATSELVKNTSLLANSDYANYVAALGYLKSNDFVNATTYIDTAIKMNPQNLNYKKLKAEILSQGKKPKDALKMVEYIKSQKLYSADFTRKVNSLEHYVLYKSKKNYSEKMYHLGYYYYYENELAKAVRTLQSALTTKKKHNKEVYSILSRVYYNMQDYEKAQDTALKAYKIDDGDPVTLLVLGDLSFREGDYKTALKYYRDAEGKDKTSSICSLKVAQTYEQLGKEKKAYEIYERILKTYSDCWVAYYKIALKDKSKEIAYLKKAIAINMNFKDAWIDLGRVEIERGNYFDAKKYLGVANYIDENDFRYYYYQGLIAKNQGMKQDAAAYFKKSLLLNPDYTPAKEELNI